MRMPRTPQEAQQQVTMGLSEIMEALVKLYPLIKKLSVDNRAKGRIMGYFQNAHNLIKTFQAQG